MGKEVKCPHCNEWTSASDVECEHCGKALKPDRTEEEERMRNFKPLDIPLIPINEDDHWFMKGVKTVLRTGQMIFIAIASAVVYIASGAAH
jgi:methionyl-tRNA synthetase